MIDLEGSKDLKVTRSKLTQIAQLSHLTGDGITQIVMINLEECQQAQVANTRRDSPSNLIIIQVQLLQRALTVNTLRKGARDLVKVHIQDEETFEVAILGGDGPADLSLLED